MCEDHATDSESDDESLASLRRKSRDTKDGPGASSGSGDAAKAEPRRREEKNDEFPSPHTEDEVAYDAAGDQKDLEKIGDDAQSSGLVTVARPSEEIQQCPVCHGLVDDGHHCFICRWRTHQGCCVEP